MARAGREQDSTRAALEKQRAAAEVAKKAEEAEALALKLQTEFSLIDKAIGSDDTTRDLRVLTQLQMAF